VKGDKSVLTVKGSHGYYYYKTRGSEVSISVVKCSWVKCGEVLQCSGVLLCIWLYLVVRFVCFCLFLYVIYSYCYVFVFL
jgi:hypothetical protein